jgi:hypothetical protein
LEEKMKGENRAKEKRRFRAGAIGKSEIGKGK